MITLSDKAVAQLKKIMSENDKEGFGVRFAIDSGGCSGFQYKFEFEEKAGESDHIFEQQGIQVFVDPKSNLYLDEMVVDFYSDLMTSNFTFQNPNAKQTCGCGVSFSV